MTLTPQQSALKAAVADELLTNTNTKAATIKSRHAALSAAAAPFLTDSPVVVPSTSLFPSD